MSGQRDVLHMFTVHDNGPDWPEPRCRFTVRDVPIDGRAPVVPGDVIAAAPTLAGVRRQVPLCASFCLPRDERDDPTIVETWV